MSLWQRLQALFRHRADLFNLQVEPAYAIKASSRNPYFQALERRAREAGYLGAFVVDQDGRVRPGHSAALATRHATLTLDVYPNPAAIEGRTVVDYDDPATARRQPRATLVLDDDSELHLWHDGKTLRLAGPALDQAVAALPRR